jgi:hypothetical protein
LILLKDLHSLSVRQSLPQKANLLIVSPLSRALLTALAVLQQPVPVLSKSSTTCTSPVLSKSSTTCTSFTAQASATSVSDGSNDSSRITPISTVASVCLPSQHTTPRLTVESATSAGGIAGSCSTVPSESVESIPSLARGPADIHLPSESVESLPSLARVTADIHVPSELPSLARVSADVHLSSESVESIPSLVRGPADVQDLSSESVESIPSLARVSADVQDLSSGSILSPQVRDTDGLADPAGSSAALSTVALQCSDYVDQVEFIVPSGSAAATSTSGVILL